MSDKIEIRAQTAPWWSGVQLLIVKNKSAVCSEIIFRKIIPGEAISPTLKISKDEAQTLMDDLWICGLRPTEGTGSAGALAATQKHLEDMRTLVFKKDENER